MSTGVAVLGTFSSVVPPPPALAALQRLLAWKLSLHGLPTRGHVTVEVNPADAFYTPFRPGARVSLPRIAGHRDGDLTDCPGNALYASLSMIRGRASALAGTPARITLFPRQPAGIAGAAIAVSGRLTILVGAPLVGALVEVQQLTASGERTIARSPTGVNGSWATSVQLSFNQDLRALHRPAPATVSDLAPVVVAPAITLNLDSSAPLRLSGAISPRKRNVTIHVYLLQNGHRQLVITKHVAVVHGGFRAKLTIRRSGDHVLSARSAPDARNVGGTSPAVTITI